LLDSNYRLTNGSPAIQAGDPADYSADYPETDLAGEVRIKETGIDMGAYSYFAILTVTGDDGLTEITTNGAYKDITIEAGGQLTVNEGVHITAGTLTLKGNATDGMATFIDKGTTNIANASVEQTLSTGAGRRWYYLASPITGATSGLFSEGDLIGSYNEPEGKYTDPFNSATPLVAGQGYALYLATSDPEYIFQGALNTGVVSVPLTRTSDNGFNLVGNPYPSYIDWDAVAKDNVESTIWTRSYTGSEMQFYTYNADAQTGTDDQTTAHIAPLQAFWVRVSADASSTALEFTNASRLHKAEGDANLRAAKQDARTLLRLSVSNGTNADNAVILFDDRAGDGFDRYDSEKMSNNNAAIPEIYTVAGTELLAINTLPGTAEGRELPLGFKTGTAGTFSIGIHSARNLGNIAVFLIDNTAGTEFNLTAGNYEFASDITAAVSRFTLAFRMSPTGLQNAGNQSVSVYAKDHRIVVKATGANQALHVQVFNAAGQKLTEQTLNKETPIIDRTFDAGIYLVKVNGKTGKIAVK
jgi:hypothetical protein